MKKKKKMIPVVMSTMIAAPTIAGAVQAEEVSEYEAVAFTPGGQMRTDYENRCGNCHSHLEEGDKYCRVCGTKVGEGAYEPYSDMMQCIYGPAPVMRTHVCKDCGYSWEAYMMVDDQKHCPQCGGEAPVKESASENEPETEKPKKKTKKKKKNKKQSGKQKKSRKKKNKKNNKNRKKKSNSQKSRKKKKR
ncbi:MAG: hypothetical protein Q4B01_01400 [Eubacteriales bacterium]|nr:hypothetical protein [Eubacteriales bacterium]